MHAHSHSTVGAIVHRGLHGHAWLVGIAGLVVGLGFLVYAPVAQGSRRVRCCCSPASIWSAR